MSYHDKTTKEVLTELAAPDTGLSSEEAKLRLEKYGPNVLKDAAKIHPLKILLAQFKSPIVWILLVAMFIALFAHETTDFYVIAVIVILNALLGFFQEYKAEQAIAALKKLTALKANVIRDGKQVEINSADLVPGDIVLLVTGDKVPADCRLIESTNLQTLESSLTGESTPVAKQTAAVSASAQVADRTNMAHAGTTIVAGHAKAIVVGTGKNTEIGKIATLIKEAEQEPTPLQKKLAKFSIWLTFIVIGVALTVFLTGVFKQQPLFEFFLAAIALAVAAIPEGLPAVVTMSLALGVQRMAKRNALIRKLPSAETLGACDVICSDKTGTLTHNQMTVRNLFVDGQAISVTGVGYKPEGIFSSKPHDLELLLQIGALNNDAHIEKEGNNYKVFGDPTEGALLVALQKFGIHPSQLSKQMPRQDEIEFTSERKIMTTIHTASGKKVAYMKGAPDVLIEKCNQQMVDGRPKRFTTKDKKAILDQNEKFANQALRVLGFAYKEIKGSEKKEDIEKNMTFVGLQAMIDPPRAEVKNAIKECHHAGIKVVMITGDHLTTAKAIAGELGIEGKAITGEELANMKDLNTHVDEIAIYARVNPEHKIKIVRALQKHGHIVAMTGDGVNDAPALKKADIGIAMGIAGTDVAKEASEMVLADDNFATIVSAIREGRRIYDNIGRFIEYLLSSNLGEVLTIFVSILLGMPLPIIAIQLLWINLMTDGLPAVALGLEPEEPNIMKRKPRKTNEKIIDKSRGIEMFVIGSAMAAGTLFVFNRYLQFQSLQYAQTMAFTTLVLMQLFNVLNQRSEDRSIFTINPFSNIWLVLAIASSILLQLGVLYIPAISNVFRTVGLGGMDWLWAISVSAIILVVGEIIKIVRKLNNKPQTQ
jgi:Ca2+-transporting ATPase